MTTTTNIFEEKLQAIEKVTPLQWSHGGMRKIFLRDLQREVEHVNGSFRTQRGGRIEDLNSYVQAMISRGGYVKTLPSTRERYQPIFPKLTDGQKSASKKLVEQHLIKALQLSGIVFNRGMEKRALEIIAENFICHDVDGEPRWTLLNHTDIGALWGQTSYTLNELLEQTGIDAWVDKQGTRISQLAHKAALRQQAASMLPTGSKSSEVEKLVDELHTFERRALRTGKVLPPISKTAIESEFQKFFEINGNDRSSSTANTRILMQQLDNVQSIQHQVTQEQVPSETETFKF